MTKVPDFTATEVWIIQSTVNERYGTEIELQLADSEFQIDPEKPEKSLCPVVFWHERGANFVIIRAGENRFRCQFFYTPSEQLGTGVEEYTDIAECTVALLQIQTDNEREPGGLFTGKKEPRRWQD